MMGTEFFVESLPDIPKDFLIETYSGLIPLDEDNPNRALFFVFQPRIGGPPVEEITIWMNGGYVRSLMKALLDRHVRIC